jgi:hypothetical protein
MSFNYDTPATSAQVEAAIAANPSISTATQVAITQTLGLGPGVSVVVGNVLPDGTIQQPSMPGSTPQMLTFDVGVSGPIYTPPANVQAALERAPVLVFDTDRDVRFTINGASSLTRDANAAQGINRVIQSGNGNDEITILDNGSTTIDGSGGNDTLILLAGDDSITGNIGNDSVVAGGGEDTIVSGIGIDTIDGGQGFDVVQLAGSFDDWVVTTVGDVVEISGAPGSGNGVEAVNIDFISFTGATGNEFSTVVTYTENQAEAMRLYQGLLDRSADLSGAQFWITKADEEVGQIQMANAFMSSPEYLAKYGAQTNTEFVTQLYSNALDRAPEQAGLDFWVHALDTGAASRAQLAITLINSPEGAEKIANVVLVNGLV